MKRLKLELPSSRKPVRAPTITKTHRGCYWASSRNYSRKRCLDTMKALDPDIKVIYIRLNDQNFELAIRSPRHFANGRLIFHFNANWKIESVETTMP